MKNVVLRGPRDKVGTIGDMTKIESASIRHSIGQYGPTHR
jgi:hypothetical protein